MDISVEEMAYLVHEFFQRGRSKRVLVELAHEMFAAVHEARIMKNGAYAEPTEYADLPEYRFLPN